MDFRIAFFSKEQLSIQGKFHPAVSELLEGYSLYHNELENKELKLLTFRNSLNIDLVTRAVTIFFSVQVTAAATSIYSQSSLSIVDEQSLPRSHSFMYLAPSTSFSDISSKDWPSLFHPTWLLNDSKLDLASLQGVS